MKIKLQSTTKIVELNGKACRIWEGETESGIKCHAFIASIAIDKDETRDEEFKKELVEQHVNPSHKIASYPLSMII